MPGENFAKDEGRGNKSKRFLKKALTWGHDGQAPEAQEGRVLREISHFAKAHLVDCHARGPLQGWDATGA